MDLFKYIGLKTLLDWSHDIRKGELVNAVSDVCSTSTVSLIGETKVISKNRR